MPTDRRPSETRPARMEPLARLPVFYALAGRRVLLVGGSDAAAWKAELLSATGAAVDVVAEEIGDAMRNVAAAPPNGTIRLAERHWRAADLEGAALAVGAFEDEDAGTAFACVARRAGVPVNVVDKPWLCDFAFGSIVNRSPLVIGISSDGGAPTLTQLLRVKIEALVPKGLAAWSAAAKAWRPAIAAGSGSGPARRRLWERFARMAFETAARAPEPDDLRSLLAHAGADEASAAAGEVVLVGAGPGDPDLLTLKAVRELQAADVILYDDLVGQGILDYARREARTMLVGKTGMGPSCKQDDINALMVSLARKGRRVVRLKGGDPTIFGRAGEEIEACRAAGLPVRIVPGVTTAMAAAAELGVSLTHRDHAQRLQFVTAHGRAGGLPPDLEIAAMADPRATTCIYMGRRTVAGLAARLIEAGLPAATPAYCLGDVSREGGTALRSDAGALAAGGTVEGDGPMIVLIGEAVGLSRVGGRLDEASDAPAADDAVQRLRK